MGSNINENWSETTRQNNSALAKALASERMKSKSLRDETLHLKQILEQRDFRINELQNNCASLQKKINQYECFLSGVQTSIEAFNLSRNFELGDGNESLEPVKKTPRRNLVSPMVQGYTILRPVINLRRISTTNRPSDITETAESLRDFITYNRQRSMENGDLGNISASVGTSNSDYSLLEGTSRCRVDPLSQTTVDVVDMELTCVMHDDSIQMPAPVKIEIPEITSLDPKVALTPLTAPQIQVSSLSPKIEVTRLSSPKSFCGFAQSPLKQQNNLIKSQSRRKKSYTEIVEANEQNVKPRRAAAMRKSYKEPSAKTKQRRTTPKKKTKNKKTS